MQGPAARLLLGIGLAMLLVLPAVAATGPPAPDYADPECWYHPPGADTVLHPVDLFYLYPTLPSTEGDSALLAPARSTAAVRANQRFNYEAYARGRFNFYAPLYRQGTMVAFTGDTAARAAALRIAAQDALAAFRYYANSLGSDRPFLLVGHSQGAALLAEVIRRMTPVERRRMVAAYLMGYALPADRRLRPARRAGDVGVVIAFRSLHSLEARRPGTPAPRATINPLNWRTDTLTAPRTAHRGIVRHDHATDAYRADTTLRTAVRIVEGYLICPDIDPSLAFHPEAAALFPYGDLHFMDSWLYAVNLAENMVLRARSYQSHSPQ